MRKSSHKHLRKHVARLKAKYPNDFVPDFEYENGGDDAEILFLFEKPGPMTDPRNRRKGKGGSGKISQHNPDLTAAATKEFLNRAGINPKNVILWNVVSSWNGTIRVNPEEIHRAIDDVNSLLKILKNLKTVILVGLRAQKLSKYLNLEGYNVGASLHPSPRNRARFPDRWRQIPMVWREIVGPELKNKKARKAQTRDKKIRKKSAKK